MKSILALLACLLLALPASGQTASAPAPKQRYVYLVARPGPAAAADFAKLQRELRHAASRLTPETAFAFVFFADKADLPTGGLALEPATPAAIQAAVALIDRQTADAKGPPPLAVTSRAFSAALKLKPDAVYFVAHDPLDGRILDVVTTLNTAKVRINTMAFINRDEAFQEQLNQLATRNGGVYKFIPVSAVADPAPPTPALTPKPTPAATPKPVPPKPGQLSVAGLTDPGLRVVYVLDHSGPLLDVYSFLQKELVRSIARLDARHEFAVVAFPGGEQAVQTFPAAKVLAATPAAKRTCGLKLDTLIPKDTAPGNIGPTVAALKTALALKPDVIYLLSDGDYSDALAAEVGKLKGTAPVRIHAIGLAAEPTKAAEYTARVQAFARDHGGQAKLLPATGTR